MIVANAIKYIIAIVVSLSCFAASASPLYGLDKQGQGQMNVLFWSVYKAEYFTSSTKLTDTRLKQKHSKALKLTYLRDIKKDELIDATNDQWQHLDLSLPNKDLWLKKLANIWPDINENDTLTLLVDENKISHFYLTNNEQYFVKQGEIVDGEFAEAFLSIWLAENTSRPDLRQQLLGMQ